MNRRSRDHHQRECAKANLTHATRPLLVAHGFGIPMINALVSQGLATLTYEKVRAGGKLIEVGRIRIADAGQRALKE
jgi:hypothetical protein